MVAVEEDCEIDINNIFWMKRATVDSQYPADIPNKGTWGMNTYSSGIPSIETISICRVTEESRVRVVTHEQ